MRQRKTVKIDDREITVKELTVQEILNILNDAEDAGGDQIQDLKNLVEKHLMKATDATLSDFKSMAPSEIQQVFDAFKEVNAVFFATAQRLGLGTFLEQLKAALIKDLSTLAAASLGPGT